MVHDATKVLLGVVYSSDRVITCEDADPAGFAAGLAVRRKADGGLRLDDDSTATLIGISLGPDLSDTKKTAVCRNGNLVPLRLRAAFATGEVVITSYANLVSGTADTIEVAGVTFTAQAGAATLGTATFQAATSDEATAASLAAQINGHATAGAAVTATVDGDTVTITAKSAGEAGNDITLDYTDNDTNVGATVSGAGTLEDGDVGMDSVVKGATVYVDDTTGEGVDSGDASAVATGATYVSGVLTGVYSDGTTVPVALVDLSGGL